MQTLTVEQFNKKLAAADHAELFGFTKSTTRFGCYFKLRKGMLTICIFVGKDHLDNDLIEIVG